jgi:two-component system catabolic regulation response regulator CreB
MALRYEGWEVRTAASGSSAVRSAREFRPDAVVLDVMLPDFDGLEVLRRMHAEAPDVPVLFLTARDAELDRVLGLELGGDDYMAKPFSPRELVARVRARLRRQVAADGGGWRRLGRFELDTAGHRVRFDGVLLDLTRYEFGLLEALLARPGAVLDRARLMDRVWGDALESGERTVDTHVKTVRAKLRVIAPEADPIRTVRGLGYSVHVEG